MYLRPLIVLCCIVLLGLVVALVPARVQATAAPAVTAPVAVAPPAGIGALGRVEPKSRVVSLSHDAGPEGARIETLEISEGQLISAGQRVAVLSEYRLKQAELAALEARIPVTQAQIAAAAADADYAEKEAIRARGLQKARAVSKSRMDELDGAAARTRAQQQALQAELQLLHAQIASTAEDVRRSQLFSPIAGTVLKIHSWPGERVGDSGLADIADLTAMDVVAQVYERDMPRVRAGQHVHIRVPGTPMAFDGQVRELGYQVMKNDLNDTDPLADRDNRVVEVRITLPPEAAEQLKHLIYMQVDVQISE